MARSRLISKVSVRAVRVARSSTGWKTHTFVHLDIHRTPPDVVLGGFLVDNTFVLGTSASLLAGEVDKGARGRDDSAFVADGIFVEEGNRGVALQIDLVHIEAGLRVEIEVLPNNCRDN